MGKKPPSQGKAPKSMNFNLVELEKRAGEVRPVTGLLFSVLGVGLNDQLIKKVVMGRQKSYTIFRYGTPEMLKLQFIRKFVI